MPASHDLQPGSRLRRAGGRVYEGGYQALRHGLLPLLRPLFRIRAVGAVPDMPTGPLIVCANHASYLDPFFVQILIPRRIVFVMTNDFYSSPWGRWFFWSARAIPVASGRLAKVGLERALATLRQDRAVGIFPEGRLSTDGSFSPPQRGVSILSRLGRAPVLPLGLVGNLRAWPRGSPRFHRADVRVAFGPLIPPPPAHPAPGRTEERAFAQQIMEAIGKACDRARAVRRSRRPQ